MSRHRPLTLPEHERLGELLWQAQESLYAAYQLASRSYTVADLAPLERLWRTGGAIDRLKSRLDSKLYRESLRGHFPQDAPLATVYYGVDKRLHAKRRRPHAPTP